MPERSRPDPEDLGATRQPDLTTRERDVLMALVRGLDTVAIGQELHLSPRTVRNYVSQLYQKIGVTNRVQALLWWSDQVAER